MYSFGIVFITNFRFLNKLKKTVKNKARVEGSIREAYLTQEIAYFSSHYFGPQVKVGEQESVEMTMGL